MREMPDTISSILTAVEAARLELKMIQLTLQSLDDLQVKAEQLQAWITQSEQVLALYLPDDPGPSEPEDVPASENESFTAVYNDLPPISQGDDAPPQDAEPHVQFSMADYAHMALDHFGQPTSIQDCLAYLRSLGLLQETTAGKKLADILRHHKLFLGLSRGVYALRSWPAEQKRVRP